MAEVLMRRRAEQEDVLMLLAAIAQRGAARPVPYQTPGEVWAEQVADMATTPEQRRAARDEQVAAFIARAGG